MFDFSNMSLEQLVVHQVGNKLRDEGFFLSPRSYEMKDGNVEELLLKYFLSSFKEKVVYKFFHETNIHLNELYMYVSSILIDPETFYEQSISILSIYMKNLLIRRLEAGSFIWLILRIV